MLKNIDVNCIPPYPVYLGRDILSQFNDLFSVAKYTKRFIVYDESVSGFYGALELAMGVNCNTFLKIKGGEDSKEIETVAILWGHFLQAGLDRNSLVVCVGGGATLDLVGFAASTYMRGINFIHVPTTLLSQVDASIGGKTGVNSHGVKNLVGAFRQPVGVLVDTAFLVTLDDRQFRSGVAEMIKHGLMLSSDHCKELQGFNWMTWRDKVSSLAELVYNSCQLKAKVVAEDPKETGLRKSLNFGHTVGHAIEVISHSTEYPLTHGEAVSLGMCAEITMAIHSGVCDESAKVMLYDLLISVGLPTKLQTRVSFESIEQVMYSDKKNVAGRIMFAVPSAIGLALTEQSFENQVMRAGVLEIM
jgi:3-dehydroquinate synthase